jgi:hypothetical protein
VQTIFIQARYRTDRKNVPHSRGLEKADLVNEDFRLTGVRNVVVDVSLRDEFHGSCADPQRNGEASHADVNGTLDAAVNEKLDNYQHDYNTRNYFFLPAVMTTSGRISRFSVRFTYCLVAKQRTTSQGWASSTLPPRHTNNAKARTSITIAPPSASHAPRPPP